MIVRGLAGLMGLVVLLEAQSAVPSGTVLEIRLTQSLSSYREKAGTPVGAVVIAPVVKDGRVLVPLRTSLSGVVREVRRVGLGFSRDTALLHLDFTRLRLPGQPEQPLAGQVVSVDNARERVDERGRIRGILATSSFSTMVAGAAVSVAAFDPMALSFALSSSLSIFRIPDASIVLPAGTELHFRLNRDLAVPGAAGPALPAPDESPGLDAILPGLPYRTATENNAPSDLTSLLYAGSAESIERAFLAAGWVRADRLDARSTYGVMRSIVENQGYRAAPMSLLLLDGQRPVMEFAKTLNTFFSRHHLRVYATKETYAGRPVFTSTATYDSGIGFSRQAKTFIHLINENIDEERAKVVNDLVLTGCVAGVDTRPRPWAPRDARNATGDALRTDGAVAVLTLSDCLQPDRADAELSRAELPGLRMSPFLRPVRAAVLSVRHDFLRGNVIYQGYQGTRMAMGALHKKAAAGQPGTLHLGGQEFLVVNGAAGNRTPGLPDDAGHQVERAQRRERPPQYDARLLFSLSSGLSGYGNNSFSVQPFTLNIVTANGVVSDPLPLANELSRGWTLSPHVTLHSWRHISNEFSYSRTITNFRIAGRDAIAGQSVDVRSKAAIRRYAYNVLFHARPVGARFRPYAAAGPALQLIHLLEAQPEKAGLLRFVARDVVLFKTAYDFGSKPPLEGGGIFQPGLDYGAGALLHVTPRLFLRADFRETLSAQPDFWKSSVRTLQAGSQSDTLSLEYSPLVKSGPLRHRLFTVGIGISF